MAQSISERIGGSCDFNIRQGYPFLINEEKLSQQMSAYAEEYLGKKNVEDVWMPAEDFDYYSLVNTFVFLSHAYRK